MDEGSIPSSSTQGCEKKNPKPIEQIEASGSPLGASFAYRPVAPSGCTGRSHEEPLEVGVAVGLVRHREPALEIQRHGARPFRRRFAHDTFGFPAASDLDKRRHQPPTQTLSPLTSCHGHPNDLRRFRSPRQQATGADDRASTYRDKERPRRERCRQIVEIRVPRVVDHAPSLGQTRHDQLTRLRLMVRAEPNDDKRGHPRRFAALGAPGQGRRFDAPATDVGVGDAGANLRCCVSRARAW
jgi:hypothetical protein